MKAFETFTLTCFMLLVQLMNVTSQGDFEYGGSFQQSVSFTHSSHEEQEFKGKQLVKSSDQHFSSLSGQHSTNQPESSLDKSFSVQLNDYSSSTDPDGSSQASLIMTQKNSAITPDYNNEDGTAIIASSDHENGAQAIIGHYQSNHPSSPGEATNNNNLPNLPESEWFNSKPDASNYGQIVYVNQPPNSISKQPSITIATVPLAAGPSSKTQTTVVNSSQRLDNNDNGPDSEQPTATKIVYNRSIPPVPSPPLPQQGSTLPYTFPSSLSDPLPSPLTEPLPGLLAGPIYESLPAPLPELLPEPLPEPLPAPLPAHLPGPSPAPLPAQLAEPSPVPSPAPMPGSIDYPIPHPLPVTPRPLPHPLPITPRPLPYQLRHPLPYPLPPLLPKSLPCSNRHIPCKKQPSLPNRPTAPAQPIKPNQPNGPKPYQFGRLPDPNKYEIYYTDMENGEPKESKCKYYDIIKNDEVMSAVRGGFNMKILSILYGCDTAPVIC